MRAANWVRWSALVGALWAAPAPCQAAEVLAYVPIASSFVVDIIDLRDGHRVGGIPVALAPIGVDVDGAHGRVYIAHQGGNRVTQISTASRSVIGTVQLPSDAWSVVVSDDGAIAYVSISGADAIGVIDTATMTLLRTFPVGNNPRGMALHPTLPRMYVANQDSASVSAVDLASETVIATIPVGDAAFSVAMSPDGSKVYAGTVNALQRIDTATLAITGTLTLPAVGSGVAVKPDGSRVYVANGEGLAVVDGTTHALITNISLPGPYGVSINSDGTRVYAINVQAATMSAIDTATNTAIAHHALTGGVFADGDPLAPATAPDAPVILSATGGNGTATLTFETPAFDGGAAIDHYQARCGAVEVDGPGSPLQVGSLTNGTPYACTVRAFNSVGASLYSTSVSVTPFTIPGAPTIGNVAPGPGQASVGFAAPQDNGGNAISGYTALCNPGAHSANGGGTPIVVGGLANGTVYRCSVRASNAAGTGPASALASVIPGNAGIQADLSIAKSNGTEHVIGGAVTTYVITVQNLGPAAAANARVLDMPGTALSNLAWSCSGIDQAQCQVASGNGTLDTLVDLPIGSTVNLQVTALVAAQPEGDPVFNSASVSTPVSLTDPVAANNLATDGPDQRGLLQDGFE